MARVRNIGGIGNRKPIPVTHFVPPIFNPVWKVEIITDTETIDVTDLIYNGDFSDGVTETIGDFAIRLIDPSNDVTNRIEDFDTLKIYLDYGQTATTLRFIGKIERRSNAENIWLDISGRSIGMLTTGTNITYSSSGPKARSVILTEIIDKENTDGSKKYFNGEISSAGIEEDLVTMDVNYSEIPFWTIVQEVCENGGRDAYVNVNQVFNYFEKGSRENITEAVVENVNLIDTEDYAQDTEEIVTKVRVYGATTGNVPIISSSESDTTNTKGIIKEQKIDNASALTPDQAKGLADAQALTYKEAPTIGNVISILTPTILPGEKLKIANPINNIPPAYYEISSYRHMFVEDGAPKTVFTIKKAKLDSATLFKKQFKFQSESTTNINPEDMDNTIIYDYNFNVGDKLFSTGTHSNTELEINNSSGIGVLRTISGDTGTWTSPEVLTSKLISKVEIRYEATDIGTTKFFISLDKGATYKEIGSLGGDFIFENAENSVIVRVDIKSANTRIEKIGIYHTFAE